MATKNDLIEAQSFSRRRLLTAFVSGAPGGKELEPAAPLRAVFTAIALAAAVILVGVFWGIVRPGLPSGWDNGRLVLVSDTGARYVTIEGKLHPVINTASARLLIPSSDFDVITTDQATLSGIELDSTLGIVGAPDSLPARAALVGDGWTACVAGGGLDVRIEETPAAKQTSGAFVVSSEKKQFVVAGGQRFEVSAKQSDAILRAVGLGGQDVVAVPTPWLNLFTPGTTLQPLSISGAGDAVSGTQLTVGQVVHIDGSADDERFVVRADRTLAPLSPLAWQLYQLGSGLGADDVTAVTAAQVAGLRTGNPIGGADWPSAAFAAPADATRPCALLDEGTTTLAEQPTATEASVGVHVAAGHGALVRSGGRGDQSVSLITLVDATGTAYALPGATTETVKRLGYTEKNIAAAEQAWTDLLRTGPALTEEAAGRTPSGGGQ
jgi:Protein of unknown function (DUF690).